MAFGQCWRAAARLLRAAVLASLVLFASGVRALNEGIPSEVFAVFVKGGSELIVNLGDHDLFTQVSVPPSSFPASFANTLNGATLTVVGDFDENLAVAIGGNPPIARPNIVFSTADDHPEVLTDGQQATLFQKLTGGTTGFIDTVRSIPVGSSAMRQANASNSFTTLVGNTVGGAFPFSLAAGVVTTQGGLLLPVFGAAVAVQPGLGGPPSELGVVLELKITAAGLITRLVPSDLKPVRSRVYAILKKPSSNEVTVFLGDHDNLAASPVQLDAAGLAALGGNLDGATLTLVGVFNDNLRVTGLGAAFLQQNVMVSSPGGLLATMTDPQIVEAFNRLTLGTTGFFDVVPQNLSLGGTSILPTSSPNSFASKFGTGGLPFAISGTVGPVGLNLPLLGAAVKVQPTPPNGPVLAPREFGEIQLITVSPTGLFTATHTI